MRREDLDSTDVRAMPADQDASKCYDPTDDEYYYGYGCTIVSTGQNEGLDILPSSIEAIRLEMLSGNEDAREFYLARNFEIDGQSEFEIADETYPTEIYVRSL